MAHDTMEALRADVVRFTGSTPAEADGLLRDIATIFVLRPEELSGLVQGLMTAAAVPRGPMIMFLHILARLVQTEPGQDLILSMAGIVLALRKGQQAKPTGRGH